MRILIIEDDVKLCNAISFHLKNEGFLTDACNTGDDGLFFAMERNHDLIILDRLLPEIDGITLLDKIRKNHIETPVIMVTALGELNDRIDGFETGADDYLVKPFAMEELIVRVKALLRRPKKIDDITEFSFSNIKLNIQHKILSSDTGQCELSKKEAALMEFFLRNKNQILSRDIILNRVWGYDSFVCEANLDNYISFLRKRLKSINSRCKISTIHSVGYRLEE
ncbi:response regulator transcription factor [Mobilitalea sibirica]|uniref:Stage 0 sporulation protein A homolog n=1 Tax=Mobilitalea sibirica TaxID=1462919 RepID=A0A8J7H9W6_9FIRM|nr:response regulator transcription factor [Mobilitalea sibirica]MBH1939326.1 response regulator transcription factor [Mobilitalea sibirica]